MWKHIASTALSLFVVVLFAIGALVFWARAQYRAEGPLEQAICLEVPRGSTMRAVSQELEERDAVASGTLFRIGARYTEKDAALKAGSYLVPEGASMPEILEIITTSGAPSCGSEIVFRVGLRGAEVELREFDPETMGYVEQIQFAPGGEEAAPEAYTAARADQSTRYRVLAVEGTTSWQVATALQGADFLAADTDAVPPEGMIAPGSYEVTVGASLAELLAQMQARQAEILNEAWANRVEGLPFDTPEEALILASIVEKETGRADERRQVASVFVNRLNRPMRLQSDPTVIYGVTKGQGLLGRGIRQSELKRETPYNTYVIDGLPPTPIANPGAESIKAVMDPAKTDYLYFVAGEDGGHVFAATLDEHNRNVANWRKIEDSQGK